MRLLLKILRHGQPDIDVDVPIQRELTMEQVKALWEAEQALNNLPANIRVHINLGS